MPARRMLRYAVRPLMRKHRLREQQRQALLDGVSEQIVASSQAESLESTRIFQGVGASQSERPPVLSLLCVPEDLNCQASGPGPGDERTRHALFTSLVAQSSSRWELLIALDESQASQQQDLHAWVSRLRQRSCQLIRVVNRHPGLDLWGHLVAWSAGVYLMPVSTDTWLDPDLVACLEARLKQPGFKPAMITLDGLKHSENVTGVGVRPDQVWLGLPHDPWSLSTGWGALPHLLQRRWLVDHYGLAMAPLTNAEHWRNELHKNQTVPDHYPGLFATVPTFNSPAHEDSDAALIKAVHPSGPRLNYTAVIVARSTTSNQQDNGDSMMTALIEQMQGWTHPPAELVIVSDELVTMDQTFNPPFRLRHLPLSPAVMGTAGTLAAATAATEACSHELMLLINSDFKAVDIHSAEVLLAPYAAGFTGISAQIGRAHV